jgi:hypothetical protein
MTLECFGSAKQSFDHVNEAISKFLQNQTGRPGSHGGGEGSGSGGGCGKGGECSRAGSETEGARPEVAQENEINRAFRNNIYG